MSCETKPTNIAPRATTFGHGDDKKKESAIMIASKPLSARDRVNLVILNVDNTKWEQGLDKFGVEGIPHFAFLDGEGNKEENIMGRLPRQNFFEYVNALSREEASIPHSHVVGSFSTAESRQVKPIADPRSHG